MKFEDLTQKEQSYDDLIITAREYAYESLVFRFKDYQSKAFQSEVNDYKYQHNSSETEARMIIRERHNRDLDRFIEILNEMIDRHDEKI